jgi:hypothetical protein
VNRPRVLSGSCSRRYPPDLRERAVRVVAASSDQHEWEWAAIGEVAPLLLAAGTPKAPHLRIHTNTNRLTALIPRLSSGIVRRPAPCDRRIRFGGSSAHHPSGSPMWSANQSSARCSGLNCSRRHADGKDWHFLSQQSRRRRVTGVLPRVSGPRVLRQATGSTN